MSDRHANPAHTARVVADAIDTVLGVLAAQHIAEITVADLARLRDRLRELEGA